MPASNTMGLNRILESEVIEYASTDEDNRSWRITFSMEGQIVLRGKPKLNEVEKSMWDSRKTVHNYEVGDVNLKLLLILGMSEERESTMDVRQIGWYNQHCSVSAIHCEISEILFWNFGRIEFLIVHMSEIFADMSDSFRSYAIKTE